MDDLISRQAAMTMPVLPKEHRDFISFELDDIYEQGWNECQSFIAKLPSAQPERKKGKWTEKHHAYSDEESVIEEWQSCRCSECGRYDTRPYMYYFSEPNYCSYCGADMRGEQDIERRKNEQMD